MGFLRKAAAAALVLIGLYALLTVVSARPGDASLFPPAAGAAATRIYLVHNGYHTDVVLPVEALRRRSGPAARALSELPPSPWVMAGWGDAAFYLGRGLSLERVGEGLRAIAGLGETTAVRLISLDRPPDEAFEGGVLALDVSVAGLERLLARLDAAFRLQAGEPILIEARLREGEAFFESPERFHLFKMCNHWAGELVNAAGAPTTPALHVPPHGLFGDPRLRARAGAAASDAARARSPDRPSAAAATPSRGA